MSRKQRIEQTLQSQLNPDFLEVLDESHRHSVPDNAQTHFKVTAVSSRFDGLSLIKRHRLVNGMLSDEFSTGLHALSLHLKTPTEWGAQASVAASPACRGGSKHG